MLEYNKRLFAFPLLMPGVLVNMKKILIKWGIPGVLGYLFISWSFSWLLFFVRNIIYAATPLQVGHIAASTADHDL